MSKTSKLLEDLLKECGGNSRFQFMMYSLGMVGKISCNWSMIMMSFAGSMTDWWCLDNANVSDATSKDAYTMYGLNSTRYQNCDFPGNSTCETFVFQEDMGTVRKEWLLVCGNAWISAMITTIQMVGVLVGSIMSGHVADKIGRKPTFFIILLVLAVFNFLAYFSVSWQMFIALRFFIGWGVGAYIVVHFAWITEFLTGRGRTFYVGFNLWPMGSALFALAAWLIHDWRYLHIASGAVAVPFLFFWWVTPESFRWLVSHGRMKEAETCIARIARMNGKPIPDLTKIKQIAAEIEKEEKERTKLYTFIDIFRTWKLAKTSIIVGFIWMSQGYGYYSIVFGVQSFTGNLYLNIFLVAIVDIPSQLAVFLVMNVCGRKPAAVLFYGISAIGGLLAGGFQYIDTPYRGELTLACALLSQFGVAGGWGASQILTAESYPTVVRNIGYGFMSMTARVGAMIAPQMVFVSETVDGIMFFVGGSLLMINACLSILLKETKGLPLPNLLDEVSMPDSEDVPSGIEKDTKDTNTELNTRL